MKCHNCKQNIEYEAGVQYVILSTMEMMYSEHCICPTEIERITLCNDCWAAWYESPIESSLITQGDVLLDNMRTNPAPDREMVEPPEFHDFCERIFIPGTDYRTGDIRMLLREHIDELREIVARWDAGI